jgi:thiosulfate/3-mercaptopyruvate sulfurtransferase
VIITGSNGDDFLNSVHGEMTCQACHLGAQDGTFAADDMAAAHQGMYADPSAEGACNACHGDVAQMTKNSLHTNLWGYLNAIEDRCGFSIEGTEYMAGFNANCSGCHTTCGQCHISRPNSVGGGFINVAGQPYSHKFRRTPHMTEQCTACHGSRVGTDFQGQIEGNFADLHFDKGMSCMSCHSGEEIHGDGMAPGGKYEHRYQVETMPRCETCHPPAGIDNRYHNVHVQGGGAPNLQCQVCHSQPYKNCTNCHDLGSKIQGAKYNIEPSRVQFKIARNPSPYRTEYNYAVVRHTPIDPDTYADWGLSLPEYSSKPTWQYASPHNVRRWTDQTTLPEGENRCGINCHGTDVYLRETDLYEDDGVTRLPDYDANIGIVIEN